MSDERVFREKDATEQLYYTEFVSAGTTSIVFLDIILVTLRKYYSRF